MSKNRDWEGSFWTRWLKLANEFAGIRIIVPFMKDPFAACEYAHSRIACFSANCPAEFKLSRFIISVDGREVGKTA